MDNNFKKITSTALLTLLGAVSYGAWAESSGASGQEESLRRIDDGALRQLIKQSTTPFEELDSLPLVEIVDDVIEDKKSDDKVLSQIYDSVSPVTRTIFLDPENPTEIPVIKTSKSRDSIIPFFEQGMEPLKITGVFIKNNPVVGEGELTNRFEAEKLEDISNGNIVRFSTNVLNGWNTVQLSFEGYDQLMALKIVAGEEYDLSSKAVLLNNSFSAQTDGNVKSTSAHAEIVNYTGNTDLKRALIEYANSGITPNGRSDKQFALEIFQVPSGILPTAVAYKSKIGGKDYILLRSNGILVEPDYTLSQPAKTINENVYAYAIPMRALGSFISIEYQEKRFIYLLASRGISNAIQN